MRRFTRSRPVNLSVHERSKSQTSFFPNKSPDILFMLACIASNFMWSTHSPKAWLVISSLQSNTQTSSHRHKSATSPMGATVPFLTNAKFPGWQMNKSGFCLCSLKSVKLVEIESHLWSLLLTTCRSGNALWNTEVAACTRSRSNSKFWNSAYWASVNSGGWPMTLSNRTSRSEFSRSASIEAPRDEGVGE